MCACEGVCLSDSSSTGLSSVMCVRVCVCVCVCVWSALQLWKTHHDVYSYYLSSPGSLVLSLPSSPAFSPSEAPEERLEATMLAISQEVLCVRLQ